MQRILLSLMLLASSVLSSPMLAQDKKLSVSFNDDALSEVFKKLEAVSDYHFVVDCDVSPYRVTGNLKNETLFTILNYALSGTPIGYSVSGKQITVVHKAAQDHGNKISGVVIAESDGEPLVGAQVRIEGTKVAAVTNVDGQFSLNVAPRKGQKLTVSYIGMKSVTLAAGPTT